MTFGSKKRCRATGKRTGEQCKNPVIAGGDFCFLHTERPAPKRGAPKNNKNNLKHGANSETIKEYKRRIARGKDLEPGFLAFDILNKDERKTFRSMVGEMCEEFDPDTLSDCYRIELLSLCMILLNRAVKDGNTNAVETLDRMVRRYKKDLRSGKATLKIADAGLKTNREITPAEWAAAILKSVKEEEKHERAGQPEDKKAKDGEDD